MYFQIGMLANLPTIALSNIRQKIPNVSTKDDSGKKGITIPLASITKATVNFTTSIMSQKQRRVSFQKEDKVIEIPSRREATREERRAISFSSDDLNEMRQRDQWLSQKLSQCGGINTLEDDLTGLFSFEANTQRNKRIVDGIVSVLAEQEYQCDKGSIQDHSECIASAYSRAVNESILLARNRGHDIAMEVEEECKEGMNQISCPLMKDPNPCRWDTKIADSDFGVIFETARRSHIMRAPISRMIVIPIEDMTRF